MTNQDIKKLAKLTAQDRKVDKKLANFVFSKMSRKELILYLTYLKNYLNKMIVTVSSNTPIAPALKKTLAREFAKKEVVFNIDKSIKDGIKVMDNDTIIDLSIEGYLNKTVSGLKQEL
ncbi:MAG TPA: F0F1 ATP synthase subunit delta [Patescibacteria group bacterium]|nr:F0F1 ATP synthase subunit delta [Patescibacteria group bacterium]